MALNYHPPKGAILRCDFSQGFQIPEMVKERLVVVLTPQIKSRHKLSTVVALSTTPPKNVMQYHAQIDIEPPLPPYYTSNGLWVKGDMVNAVGFHRLNFVTFGKKTGTRNYYQHTLSADNLTIVQKCVLRGMGLQNLTKHL